MDGWRTLDTLQFWEPAETRYTDTCSRVSQASRKAWYIDVPQMDTTHESNPRQTLSAPKSCAELLIILFTTLFSTGVFWFVAMAMTAATPSLSRYRDFTVVSTLKACT
jgi:hypothetical protein